MFTRSLLVSLAPLVSLVLMLLFAASAEAVSVIDFGAVGDGVANDAPAIQAALDSGASVVTVPGGTYNIGQGLLIGSQTALQVDPQAVIWLANGTNEWMIRNRNPGDSNIEVTGGIWDGNNAHNNRGSDNDPNAYTGTAINFVNTSDLVLSGLTVRNPEAFSIALGNIQNFRVENIVLDQSVSHPNQDGVHVGGHSHHGVISGITAVTSNTPNDDMVAINADDDPTRAITRAMPCGPISDILVENLQADAAYNFVRILSNTSSIDGVTVRGVSGGCRILAVNMNRWAFPLGAGNIQNVLLEDFNVSRVGTGTLPMIDIGLNVENLQISNFVRGDSGSASTLRISNSQNNVLRFADGSELTVGNNYTIGAGSIDYLLVNPAEPDPPPHGLVSPVAVPYFSGPTDGTSIENVFDGDTNTFVVVLDDTLTGSSTATVPEYADAPVTGHMVFDMGEVVSLLGAKLTSRNHTSALSPKDVDFFYYADDDPSNNALVDDIEGDADIISITNHVFSGINLGSSEAVEWEAITARYIGMRVNSAYEAGPTYYNFQIAEMEFDVQGSPIPGDANEDGKVNDQDASILAAHWQMTEMGWGDGDFNNDGVVNDQDASILAAHWQETGEGASSPIPEPSTLVGLLALGLAWLVALRRR